MSLQRLFCWWNPYRCSSVFLAVGILAGRVVLLFLGSPVNDMACTHFGINIRRSVQNNQSLSVRGHRAVSSTLKVSPVQICKDGNKTSILVLLVNPKWEELMLNVLQINNVHKLDWTLLSLWHVSCFCAGISKMVFQLLLENLQFTAWDNNVVWVNID